MKYIKLFRFSHYIKNLLIVLPLFFSRTFLNNIMGLFYCVVALICFCLASSAIYIFNDIQDINVDKFHPRKSQRPIASGAVSVKSASFIISFIILICGIISIFFLPPFSFLFLIAYLVVNVLYSLCFKNIPILDVTCIAFGFLLRLMFGAFVSGVIISNWLYLTVIVASFYMALGKRRNELVSKESKPSRKVLEKYNVGFLDKSMTTMITSTIVFYSLWCLDAATIERYGTDKLIWTVPIVIIISLKYNLNIEKNNEGDPVEVLTRDIYLIILVVIYVCLMTILLYAC